MSRVADSSFIITLFDPDDPRRDQAMISAEDPEPILVPPEVVTETVGIIHSRLGYNTAEALWEDLGGLDNFVFLNSTQGEQVAPIFIEGRGRISWTDAAVVAHCLREDAEPLCFDPDIQAAYEAATGASGTSSG